MKASEEVALEYFVSKCVEKGITSKAGIIEEAQSANEDTSQLREFLNSGMSRIHEKYGDVLECDVCEAKGMYDESEDEWYCPMCRNSWSN